MVNTLNSKVSDSAKDVPEQESSSLISNEKLRELYAAMVKCRMLEQRATELFQHGKLPSDFHRSPGCEASAAAVAVDLTPDDMLCVAPGAWLPAFVKGMSAESLLRALALGAEPTGAYITAETERSNALLGGDHPQQHKLVLSRAAEARATKNGAVVVVFISSAHSSLDDWSAVMTSAAAKTLPIVFVHHTEETKNNVPSSNRARNPEALFHGVPAISVDATDPVAIYRVAFEAILRARQDRGATLLECITVAAWPVDPVSAMENYLRRKGIQPHGHQIVETFQRELDRAACPNHLLIHPADTVIAPDRTSPNGKVRK